MSNQDTVLIKLSSVYFLYVPELHLRGTQATTCFSCMLRTYLVELETVDTDFIICRHRWQQYIARPQEDRKEFVLYVRSPIVPPECDLRILFR